MVKNRVLSSSTNTATSSFSWRVVPISARVHSYTEGDKVMQEVLVDLAHHEKLRAHSRPGLARCGACERYGETTKPTRSKKT